MSGWLSNSTANRYKRSYFNEFVDISGNMTVRHGDLDIIGGNVGIGNINPIYNLEIKGDSTDATSDDYQAMRIHATAASGITSFSTLILDRGNYGGAISGFHQPGIGGGLRFSTINGGVLDEKMRINRYGAVGIGTDIPYAKLHINGVYNSGIFQMATRNWIKYTVNSANVQRSTNTVTATSNSIYASGDIVTNNYLISSAISVTSDRRIKHNIVDVNDGSALETLRLLKPKKYEYKDKMSKTQSVVWGFIAQEVAETLPYATHTGKKEIPNIYQVANVSNGNHLTFATDIQFEYDASGALVNDLLLYDASDNRIDATIQEVVSATELRVASERSLTSEVFVYGQKVDDFHYLNKQAIFTVATSALQEVDRQLQAEKAKTATLQTQLVYLIARVTALENK